MNQLISLCQKITAAKYFTRIILILILLNAVLIGLETSESLYDQYGALFQNLDQVILWLFTLELLIRLMAVRFSWRFFKDPWNTFDFVIVLSGLFLSGSSLVTLLRIVRVFRLFRALAIVPSLRKLTNALLLTLPSLGTIMLFMGLLFYVFAVIGTMLYRDVASEYFGTLPLSVLTLFQIVTLEAWASDVMRPVMSKAPYAWIYFVSFVLVGTFVILNLLVGVIVSNVERAQQLERQQDEEQEQQQLRAELTHIREELRQIRQYMQEDRKEGIS